MTKYVIFDIDGILSPTTATDLLQRGYKRYEKDYMSLMLNPEYHAPMLQAFEKHGMNIVWGSSWEAESNFIAEVFNLKNTVYPHIPLHVQGEAAAGDKISHAWKLNQIVKWVRANLQPDDVAVWIDDEMDDETQSLIRNCPQLRVYPVDTNVGLTGDDAVQVMLLLHAS